MPSVHIVFSASDIDSDALICSLQAAVKIYPSAACTIINQDAARPISPRAAGIARSLGVKTVDMPRDSPNLPMPYLDRLITLYAELDADVIVKIEMGTIITSDIVQDMIAAGASAQFVVGLDGDYSGSVYAMSREMVGLVKSAIASIAAAGSPGSRLLQACQQAMPGKVQTIPRGSFSAVVFSWATRPMVGVSAYAYLRPLPSRIIFDDLSGCPGDDNNKRRMRDMCMRQLCSLLIENTKPQKES
jgi:hypothetical protein